jgi:lipid-A-disaccharide synthase
MPHSSSSNTGSGSPTIFFSVGEPSGDVHGANLIRALRERCPAVEAVGYGGPRMAEAGCDLHADLTALAVMWFLRVLLNIHKFWRLYRRAGAFFRDQRPDAIVLIDYPGFNWWIARAAKRHDIPVFYYVPPQIWAWGRWRVKKMRRLVDHVLCTLPFEQAWYAAQGCHATLVGHPFFDEVTRHRLDQEFIERVRRSQSSSACHPERSEGSCARSDEILRSAQNDGSCAQNDGTRAQNSYVDGRIDNPSYGPLVTILPGSRTQELTHNLHWLLKAAQGVYEAVPGVRFAVAAFKPAHAEMVARHAEGLNLPIEIHVGRTPELIRAADCCLAKSGSVSLELLYHCKPTVVLYWITRTSLFAQSFFRKVKYITLVNLLSADDGFTGPGFYHPAQPGVEKVLFPEYLTCEDKSEQLAEHVIGWLTDEEQRDNLVARLAELKARVCHPGAARRAAEYVLSTLGTTTSAIPAPHFSHQRAGDDRAVSH